MLHLIYILAFTIIAFLAISNLIRSLIHFSTESQRFYAPTNQANNRDRNEKNVTMMRSRRIVPHPELLDDKGKPINEPLLVMRSVTVEDARQRLDALYNSSPNSNTDSEEQA
jgi:hypothetical protein